MFLFEATVGETEGIIGIDAVATAPVDKVEKFLAKFLFSHLGGFSGIVSGTGNLLLHSYGLDKRWERIGHAFEDVLAAFAHLELFPVFAVVVFLVVYKRMACYQFFADSVIDIRSGEKTLLFSQLAVEKYMHGDVAKFFFNIIGRLADDSLRKFVYLFDGKVSQAFGLPSYIKPICLLPVGYASAESVPYAPWHDVYRDIGNFTEVL